MQVKSGIRRRKVDTRQISSGVVEYVALGTGGMLRTNTSNALEDWHRKMQ